MWNENSCNMQELTDISFCRPSIEGELNNLKHDKNEQTDVTHDEFELDDCLLESNDIVITQNKDGYILHVKKLGNITSSKITSVEGAAAAIAAIGGGHDINELHHVEIPETQSTITVPSTTMIDNNQTKPTLTQLATCQIKLPSSECGKLKQGKVEKISRENVIVVPKSANVGEVLFSKLVNMKKITQPSTSVGSGQEITTATIIQPQIQEHSNTVLTSNQQAINNLIGLREINILPKMIGSRIKYSRGTTRFSNITDITAPTTTTTTTVQLATNSENNDMDEKKYEIAEIDLNNAHSSATIISDLVKYAEIDDIELADGTKIGINFAPAEITEQHIQNDGSTAATILQHHQSSQDQQQNMSTIQTTSHQVQSQIRNGTEHQIPKSYTILTTQPIKTQLDQHQQTTYELSISDNSMSQSEESEKLHICRHCGKKYRWKSTLRRHENVECGGKEPCHPCPYCPYKAKQRGNLGVHVRKHHPDKPQLESKRGRR